MTLSQTQVRAGLETFEIKPGVLVRVEVLKDLLPTPDVALFFGKVYKLDYAQLSELMRKLFRTTIVEALLSQGDTHSAELQDYIVDIVPPAELQAAGITKFTDDGTHEFLPELWDQLEVEIAESITQLAENLANNLALVQGKEGKMVFQTLLVLNKQRQSVLGAYKAQIQHPHQAKNLVILDDSGSVSYETVEKIAAEVVALAYKANAAFALVSNTTRYWEPGTFNVDDVLNANENGRTQYETLEQVLNENWATVITIADYDSSQSAADHIRRKCTGRISEVLDISLVSRPSFLAETVGQLADSVRPLLVGSNSEVLGSYRHEYAGRDFGVREDEPGFGDPEDDDYVDGHDGYPDF